MVNMQELADILGYHFKNTSLLEEALTHPSATREKTATDKRRKNYERLEFLGDSVLGLVVAEFIIQHFPDENEGSLAKRHAALVCGEMLSTIARKMDLGRFLIMAPGEEATGGRTNSTNLENTLEALIGAVYMDGGLKAAADFVLKYWTVTAKDMKEPPKDPKTTLQEWAQAHGKGIPAYSTIHTEGPPHAPVFTIQIDVNGMEPVSAQGTSKRLAEREAAKVMLARITSHG